MIRAALALALALCSLPAAAQNILCPTRGIGDNTNACASTQFVQQNLSSGTNLSASIDAAFGSTRGSILERGASLWQTVPPSATAGLPWVSNGTGADPAYQALTGASLAVPFTQSLAISANQTTVAGFGFNPISHGLRTSSDNASCTCPTPGQNIPTLLTVEETFGGSSINNGRNAIAANLQMTTATSPSNAYRAYVAIAGLAALQVADNGSSGTPLGEVEALTGATVLQSTATNIRTMIGGELSLSAVSGSSVAQKAVLLLDSFPADAVHGVTNGSVAGVDTFIWSFSNNIGFTTWALIDGAVSQPPLSTSGTVIKLLGSNTITTGFDFGTFTVSGNVLQWGSGSWSLAGNGNAVINNITAANLTPAWSTYSPSPSCGTASITTNAARFITTGKTTKVQLDITISTLGTCTNSFSFTLPNTANSGGGLVGRTTAGTVVNCFVTAASNSGGCSVSANLAATNEILLSGVYENQ